MTMHHNLILAVGKISATGDFLTIKIVIRSSF